MKKILKKMEFWFDYYVMWMFFNGNKTDRYIEYLENKWKK